MAMKDLKSESGRSIVEMLGTLAIVGVLSIGGITAYSYAMDRWRANETINEFKTASISFNALYFCKIILLIIFASPILFRT